MDAEKNRDNLAAHRVALVLSINNLVLTTIEAESAPGLTGKELQRNYHRLLRYIMVTIGHLRGSATIGGTLSADEDAGYSLLERWATARLEASKSDDGKLTGGDIATRNHVAYAIVLDLAGECLKSIDFGGS